MSLFASLALSGPVRAVTRPFKRGKVAVFMLHRVAGVHPEIDGHDVKLIAVALDQMRRHGVRFVSLAEIADAIEDRHEITGDSVAFTIDDGYRDQADLLAPIFLEREVPLTLFAITGFIDQLLWPWDAKIHWLVRRTRVDAVVLHLGNAVLSFPTATPKAKRRAGRELVQIFSGLDGEALPGALGALELATELELPTSPPEMYVPTTWQRLRELESAGLSVAAHTVTHRIISRLSTEQARWEIEESLSRLRSEMRRPMPILAWPVGWRRHFGSRDLALASQANVSASFASDGGYTDIPSASSGANGRHMLARYSWPDSLSLIMRYSTGIQAIREMLAADPGVGQLPARLTEPVSPEPMSVRRQVGTLIRRGIRRYQDAEIIRAQETRDFCAVQPDRVKRVVFVCTGNICRSPFAEALARRRGWPSESYGLDVTRTDSADEEANKVALMLGVDMTQHRSRSIREVPFSEADCLVAMEPEQFVAIQELKHRYGCQVTLLGAWGRRPTHRVPDPFRKDREEMERVLLLIEESVSGLLDVLDGNQLQSPDAAASGDFDRTV